MQISKKSVSFPWGFKELLIILANNEIINSFLKMYRDLKYYCRNKIVRNTKLCYEN